MKSLIGSINSLFLAVAAISLLSSCVISGEERDENEALSEYLRQSPEVKKIRKSDTGSHLVVMGCGSNTCLYVLLEDNRDPRGDKWHKYTASELAVLMNEVKNGSAKLKFPRKVSLVDYYTARKRYVIAAKGGKITAVNPLRQ